MKNEAHPLFDEIDGLEVTEEHRRLLGGFVLLLKYWFKKHGKVMPFALVCDDESARSFSEWRARTKPHLIPMLSRLQVWSDAQERTPALRLRSYLDLRDLQYKRGAQSVWTHPLPDLLYLENPRILEINN